MTSTFHSLLTLAAMRCGWENWDDVDGGEVLRLHSVLRAGGVLVAQEGGKFRLLPDIPGQEAEAVYVEPGRLDAALTALAKKAKDAFYQMPWITGEDDGFPTQAKVLTKQRLGQTRYRAELMELWGGACAVTGVDIPELLRASHAKPWRDATDRERLDPFNGFLLEARYDLLFDLGLISFTDEGCIMISSRLSAEQCDRLGISPDQELRLIRPQHLPYLAWHRERVFQRS